jgi:D-tyrosyl-tRNA(Tyr) deacylase
MKFLIQRVLNAQVDIAGDTVGKIGKGYMILIGVGEDDTKEIADRLIRKMLALRIFADENGKTNLSIKDVGGELLLVSQFTLYANCNKGNRPNEKPAPRN